MVLHNELISMQNQFLIEAALQFRPDNGFMSSTDVDRVEDFDGDQFQVRLPVDETEMKLTDVNQCSLRISDRVIKMANGLRNPTLVQLSIQTLYIDEVVEIFKELIRESPGGLGIMVIPSRQCERIVAKAAMQYDPLVDWMVGLMSTHIENKLLRRGYSATISPISEPHDAWKLKAPWRGKPGDYRAKLGSTHIPFGGRLKANRQLTYFHMDFRRESMEIALLYTRRKAIEPRFLISRAGRRGVMVDPVFTGAIDAVKNHAFFPRHLPLISSKLIVTEENAAEGERLRLQWKELFETQRIFNILTTPEAWKEIFAPNRHVLEEHGFVRGLRNLVDNHVSIDPYYRIEEPDGKRAHAVKRKKFERNKVTIERGNDLMMWMGNFVNPRFWAMFNAFFNSKLYVVTEHRIESDVWLRAPDEMDCPAPIAHRYNLGCKCPTCGRMVQNRIVDEELNSAPICSLTIINDVAVNGDAIEVAELIDQDNYLSDLQIEAAAKGIKPPEVDRVRKVPKFYGISGRLVSY
ncbi:putative PHAGE DNA-directed RNA polymerase beta subunit 3 [Salmonella phage SPFM15]|nr:putative PHAGE DNA-directed RNA polymerase beta subunit 3 [Salmonella phage SPFM5]VFR13894.1 putative PHAGE DNA-directed RNA polymerase beta subunit 3 [Salmonella phage SPFM15]